MNPRGTRAARILLLAGLATVPAGRAAARDLLFVDAPAAAADSRATVSFESAYDDHGIKVADGRAAVNRIGVELPLGARWDARVRVENTAGTPRAGSDVDAEACWTAGRRRAGRALVSLRAGARREATGTMVLLGGVAASRRLRSSLAAFSLDMEHALGADRDDVDILTSAGWMAPVGRAFRAGLEASGQDLEGLWETDEAEGGAVAFIGPTIAMHEPGSSWRFALGGGPVLRVSRSARESGAPRIITDVRDGCAIRLAITTGEGR